LSTLNSLYNTEVDLATVYYLDLSKLSIRMTIIIDYAAEGKYWEYAEIGQ